MTDVSHVYPLIVFVLNLKKVKVGGNKYQNSLSASINFKTVLFVELHENVLSLVIERTTLMIMSVLTSIVNQFGYDFQNLITIDY